MLLSEIKEYKLGNHCFGEIFTINGVDYDDLKQEDVFLIIKEMLENDLNKELILKETFKLILEYLPSDLIESYSNKCDQCGDWNNYSKYQIVK
jgi:hypothetical protein